MTGLATASRFAMVAARRAQLAGWLGLATLALVSASAWAQEEPAVQRSAARAMTAHREANVLLVNGEPALLTWARGLDDPADVEQYAAAGMSAVYVVIEGVSEEELESASALASAAEARGMMVVAALAPRALLDEGEGGQAVALGSEDYAAAVRAFVQKAAEKLGAHRGLVAWSVEAVDSGQTVWTEDGFRSYLADWYASVGAVNNSWGTQFAGWEQITAGGARDIDQTKPGGLGRATVDLAYYQETAYADALSVWARALREADPGRLVLASALTDYRSIISVRTDFDGMVLNTYPSLAEVDWRTHNVHAVDIARRAGEFAAIQTLEIGAGSDPRQVAMWISLAMQHGAAGVAFSNWRVLRDSPGLMAGVRDMLERIQELGRFPARPKARAAILYEPLAGGTMRDGRGLYGYMDGFTPNEPTRLFAVGRNGSRYGQFDVLALDSLSKADLSQYGVIIAPMALYLPQGAQLALHNYVMTGGVLVADAGVGMYQAEGAVTSLPDVLKQVFGLRYGPGEEAWSAAPTPGQVQVGDVGEVPTLLYETPRELQRARDDDLAKLAQTLDEVLDRPMLADYLGMEFLSADAPGFRVNKLGRGYGIYAPRFLYEDWNMLDPYFVQFHARVLANGSDLAVLEPAGLWPGVSVGAYSGWSVGLASPDGMPASVALYGGGNQVYQVSSGTMRVGNPADGDWVELLFPGSPLSVATPLPIYAGTAEQGGAAAVSVVRYDSERIELAIHGNGAQVTAESGGIVVRGGLHTEVEVVVRDGTYPVGPGSLHRVSVTESGAGGRDWEQEIMPNPETGVLVIQGRFASSRLTIEPAPEQS